MSVENGTGQGAMFAVVGASGQQGGATVAALREAGASVRALVRDAGSDAAARLSEVGAEPVTVDLNHPETLVEAFRDVEGVFAMTTFAGPDGPAGEVEHGRAIGDAAFAAGVGRLVYSSVGGAERHTGIPHFESKRRVEEHLIALGLPVIFIRPTFFMDNFATFSKPTVQDGTLVVRLPLPDGVPLQMISVHDVGRAAAHALLVPHDVPTGAVEIAGDELTGGQIAAAFGDARGLPGRYDPIPIEALANDADQQAMFSWFARLPAYQADIAATREIVPDLLDLPAWLARQ